MTQSNARDPIVCATCELEIVGRPTIRAGRSFCCAGCAVGGPCICSYDASDTHPAGDVEARPAGRRSTW